MYKIVITIVAVIVAIFFGAMSLHASVIKYNCNLDKNPSLYLTMWLDTTPYAYAPEKFCADVRNRMAKEAQ